MRGGFLSLVGLGFLLLAFWRAIRVRRDLATGETRWETALFGRGDPISYHRSPLRFWCAIAVNVAIVLLFGLVAAAAFRATALARL
jgi:predicted signal transduction protein with EAL and GGDEF domain